MDTVYPLHQSLLDHTTTSAATATATYGFHAKKSANNSNASDIIFRMILMSFFATVAIWANHEASKGFSIAIVNSAGKHLLPGKRFSIFYESNDKATRTVLNTSRFVETLLYPNQDSQHKKKQIKSVTLKLAAKTFPSIVSVRSQKPNEYTITLSPSLMEKTTSHNNNDEFVLAVLKGMARVWIYDGNGAAPEAVLNGIVEYITTLSGFRKSGGDATVSIQNDKICWKDEDSRKVAGFLRFHDERMGGGVVVRRLNDGMKDGWDDGVMENVLGMGGQDACASFGMLMRHHNLSSSI